MAENPSFPAHIEIVKVKVLALAEPSFALRGNERGMIFYDYESVIVDYD